VYAAIWISLIITSRLPAVNGFSLTFQFFYYHGHESLTRRPLPVVENADGNDRLIDIAHKLSPSRRPAIDGAK